MNDSQKYDNIINLPHHVSKTRPHMSMHDRAAQFAPFATVTGLEDAIRETEHMVEERENSRTRDDTTYGC